jgi:hypothetical protein
MIDERSEVLGVIAVPLVQAPRRRPPAQLREAEQGRLNVTRAFRRMHHSRKERPLPDVTDPLLHAAHPPGERDHNVSPIRHRSSECETRTEMKAHRTHLDAESPKPQIAGDVEYPLALAMLSVTAQGERISIRRATSSIPCGSP